MGILSPAKPATPVIRPAPTPVRTEEDPFAADGQAEAVRRRQALANQQGRSALRIDLNPGASSGAGLNTGS